MSCIPRPAPEVHECRAGVNASAVRATGSSASFCMSIRLMPIRMQCMNARCMQFLRRLHPINIGVCACVSAAAAACSCCECFDSLLRIFLHPFAIIVQCAPQDAVCSILISEFSQHGRLFILYAAPLSDHRPPSTVRVYCMRSPYVSDLNPDERIEGVGLRGGGSGGCPLLASAMRNMRRVALTDARGVLLQMQPWIPS
jgi:hypothetical protein